MYAMKSAIDFGTDLIKLSVTTFVQLIEIQLEDLATSMTHQSAIAAKAAAVHDIAGFLALQREYRDAFWNDRLNALGAARKTLEVALERVGHGVRELTKQAAPPTEMPKTVTPAKVTAPTTAPKKTPKRKRTPP